MRGHAGINDIVTIIPPMRQTGFLPQITPAIAVSSFGIGPDAPLHFC
jgi:hypothetical protein